MNSIEELLVARMRAEHERSEILDTYAEGETLSPDDLLRVSELAHYVRGIDDALSAAQSSISHMLGKRRV